jgi:hypothetical protein
MKEYYNYESSAPYLQTKTPSNNDESLLDGKTKTTEQDAQVLHTEGGGAQAVASEGDAAGGSVIMQRVSSFHLLRSPLSVPRPQQRRLMTVPELKVAQEATTDSSEIIPTWRLKDRMKTVGVGLVMALNIGTDPPDITKPHTCAKLQCWMDPTSMSRSTAKEKIGERLEAQYANWQQQKGARPLKYRKALDPTVDDVRALCVALRRQAKHERVLLHYNGHGVPRATANGEIWVFDAVSNTFRFWDGVH